MQSDTAAKAKLFSHGRSQAVRLPKEFRFEGSEVFVRWAGSDVVLSTRPKASMRDLIAALDKFEPGVQIERLQPDRADERESIAPKRSR